MSDMRDQEAEWRRVHTAHEELHDLEETTIAAWRKRAEDAETEVESLRQRNTDLMGVVKRLSTTGFANAGQLDLMTQMRDSEKARADGWQQQAKQAEVEVGWLRERWESSQRHANELIDRAESAEAELVRFGVLKARGDA